MASRAHPLQVMRIEQKMISVKCCNFTLNKVSTILVIMFSSVVYKFITSLGLGLITLTWINCMQFWLLSAYQNNLGLNYTLSTLAYDWFPKECIVSALDEDFSAI